MLILTLPLLFAACGKQEQNAQPKASTEAAGSKADISKIKKDEAIKLLSLIPPDIDARLPASDAKPEEGHITKWKLDYQLEEEKIFGSIGLQYPQDMQKYIDIYSKLLTDSQITQEKDYAQIKGTFKEGTYEISIRNKSIDGQNVSDILIVFKDAGAASFLTIDDILSPELFGSQENLNTLFERGQFDRNKQDSADYYTVAYYSKSTPDEVSKYFLNKMEGTRDFVKKQNDEGNWFIRGTVDGLEFEVRIESTSTGYKMDFKDGAAYLTYIDFSIK